MAPHYCPYCRKQPPSTEKGIWPFCSTRCKDADLGCWSAEAYRVPTSALDQTSDDDELAQEMEQEVEVFNMTKTKH